MKKTSDMQACRMCPRSCGVDRTMGQTGFCGQTNQLKVARAALHMWEEPCISGTRGSGTVFFSGCGLRCVFCQNHIIADGGVGEIITTERLAEIFLELQEKEACNLNLVTAAHFVPQVVEALDKARGQGLCLPVVYNTRAYEEVDTLRMLEGYVNVYLPDLKYVDAELSRKYSQAADYFDKARAAIAEMVRQVGEPEFIREETLKSLTEGSFGENSEEHRGGCNFRLNVVEYQSRSEQGEALLMTKGVIVRHLLLPGCTRDSRRVLDYLLSEYGNRIFISIMNQYTPLLHVSAYPELQRKVTRREYEAVIDYALELGLENGFIQEGDTAKESFIPDFDGRGVSV